MLAPTSWTRPRNIHLKHGNRVDARHAYDSFRLRLQSDLAEDPSPELVALLDA